MADQRSAFRFRLPWLPPQPQRQPPPRPASAPIQLTLPPTPQTREPQVPTQTTTTATTPTPPPLQAPDTRVPSQTPPQTQEPKVIPTPSPPQARQPQVPTSTISAPVTQRTETRAPSESPATAVPTPVTPPVDEIQGPTQTITTTNATVQTKENNLPNQATTIASSSTTAPQTVESRTPTTPGSPFKPPEKAPTQASPQPQVTRLDSQPLLPSPATSTRAQPRVPSQPSSPSPTTAPTRVPSQPSSPFRANSQSQVSSQPLSPSKATTTRARISSQPPSPSQATTTQARISSQPPSPSQPTSTRARVASQPESPSRGTIQSQNSSKTPTPTRTPASPSRGAPQPRAMSQPPSPSHTATQPPSTPPTASLPRPSPRSPPSPPYQLKATSETVARSTSPNQGKVKLSPERLQPSYTSTGNSFSEDKEQLNLHESEQKPIELEQKTQDIAGTNDSMNQTSMQATDQSTTLKGFDAPDQTKKGGTSNIDNQSEYILEDLKPEETKEVKEVIQEINEKTYGKSGHKDYFFQDGSPEAETQAKGQSSITFQSEKTHKANGGKDMHPTSASNGKETKTTAQLRNKTMVNNPHSKQVTSNTTNTPLHKEIRDDISKLVHKMAIEDPNNSKTDRPVSVITLAGENRGASMQLGSDSSRKGGAVHIHRGYKLKPDESDETTTNEEGSSKDKSKDAKGKEDQARESYINSNVQGINNSIMLDGSITEGSPGVHVIHSRFPKEATKATRTPDVLEKQNGDSSMIHAQKLTYQPMVKRRCLRGLFLESSDSDPDNSSKPQRHGCRVGCSKKSKDNKINIF